MSSKKITINAKLEERFRRVRLFVLSLSLVLFVITLYFVLVSLLSPIDRDITFEDIRWQFTIIIRIMISLFGYIGAFISNRKVMIATLVFIGIDLTVSFAIYYSTFDDLNSLYDQFLQLLASVGNREQEISDKDCDFFKVFRRRAVENLILVSFYVLYAETIISFIHYTQRLATEDSEVTSMATTSAHHKLSLVLLSVFHALLSIYLFCSKTFRDDKKVEIIEKRGFVYIVLWTLLAFISAMISILSPFALLLTKSKDKFFVNFFISTVIVSTLLGSAKFLIIVANEFFSDNPRNDYYCNVRFTSADNFGSILILLVVNKIIISLITSLSDEIRSNLKKKNKAKKVPKDLVITNNK